MKIQTNYAIGQKVRLITDPDRLMRIVIGIYVRQNGHSYDLACGEKSSCHFECEMIQLPEDNKITVGFAKIELSS